MAGARPLQADPEELPHPRRQIEGGNVAGHVEHPKAEPRHRVADTPIASRPCANTPKAAPPNICTHLGTSSGPIIRADHTVINTATTGC